MAAMSKKYVGAFGPFIPIVVGMALKLALIDDLSEDEAIRLAQLIDIYAKPLWLELLIAGFIIAMATKLKDADASRRLFRIPSGAFILCLVLALGAPKIGFPSWHVSILAPGVLSALALIWVGISKIKAEALEK